MRDDYCDIESAGGSTLASPPEIQMHSLRQGNLPNLSYYPHQAVGRGNTPAHVRFLIARRLASSAARAARSSSVGSRGAPSSPLPAALATGRSPACGRYRACTRFIFLSQRRSLRKSGGISELSILRRVVRGESMCVGNGRLYGYGISVGCAYMGAALLLLLLLEGGSEV